jgi:isocitrate lyase
MQMVKAGLKAIYLSGWQVAADNNVAGTMYPDQSLYPSNSGPELCRRINRTLCRADQIEHAEGFNVTGLRPSSLMQRPALVARSTRTRL